MPPKINQAAEHVVAQITDSYLNPCIVYTENMVRYVNGAFCGLFQAEELERFLANAVPDQTLFDQRPGFMWVLEEYDENDPARNRVSISRRVAKPASTRNVAMP